MSKFRIALASISASIVAILVCDICLFLLQLLVSILLNIPFLNYILAYNVSIFLDYNLYLSIASAAIAARSSGAIASSISNGKSSAYIASGIIIVLLGLLYIAGQIFADKFTLCDLRFSAAGIFVMFGKFRDKIEEV